MPEHLKNFSGLTALENKEGKIAPAEKVDPEMHKYNQAWEPSKYLSKLIMFDLSMAVYLYIPAWPDEAIFEESYGVDYDQDQQPSRPQPGCAEKVPPGRYYEVVARFGIGSNLDC